MFILNKALWNDFKFFQVVIRSWFSKHKTMKYEMIFCILYPVVIWVPIYKDQESKKEEKKKKMHDRNKFFG